jgi:hypothetical protein
LFLVLGAVAGLLAVGYNRLLLGSIALVERFDQVPAEVRAAINGLFQQLENPSAYNADQFAAALRRFHSLLR